jgi:hypothetical protein
MAYIFRILIVVWIEIIGEFGDPNYDTSREGSANIETLGQPSDIKANS